MARYPQAEWRPRPSSGAYTGGPKRLVIHTTEGTSIAGAEAAYRANDVAPHFTADPKIRRWVQHIDTALAASALANRSGGVQTNRRSAIQIEVVGYAAHTQDMPDDQLEWLGRVIFAICWTEGIPMHVHPRFVGTEAGTIATASAPQRMSHAAWNAFHGVCGHQHTPENHHWDPGRFPYDRMMRLITQEDEMNDKQERKLDRALALLEALVPNAPRTVITQGPDVGKVSASGKPVAELWRWGLETLLSARGGQVDSAEVARLVLADLEAVALSDEQVRAIIDAMPAAVKRALREGSGGG